MTNNQLCALLSGGGCFILFISMVLMFFGYTTAIWGATVGALIGVFGTLSYD